MRSPFRPKLDQKCIIWGLVKGKGHTDPCRSLFPQDFDALDNGGARIIDAIHHRLPDQG